MPDTAEERILDEVGQNSLLAIRKTAREAARAVCGLCDDESMTKGLAVNSCHDCYEIRALFPAAFSGAAFQGETLDV